MRICAFTHCSNGTYQLERWKAKVCQQHNARHDSDLCDCSPPFQLYSFPTEKKNKEQRMKWIVTISRLDANTKKLWMPKSHDCVCSAHFTGNKQSNSCPDPVINLGHKPDVKKRKPPVERPQPDNKISKLEDQPVASWDHVIHDHGRYISKCRCIGCKDNMDIIQKLITENEYLTEQLNSKGTESLTDKCEKFLKTDGKVKAYTGLVSIQAFNDLHLMLQPKAEKLKYWYGEKKTCDRSRDFASSPKKMGPKRKLTTKEELLLVLMKLRLGISNLLLADIMDISDGVVSSIFNTWIKFLASELRHNIFWPTKEAIRSQMPQSLSGYPNLRCTIDCTEVFISRPRDREIQALTWSDYKKHNTVKFLVGIAPNGAITYLSRAWGGRASDKHITIKDGFLDLVEPYDYIMADRGFNIREELLLLHATLEIPPPSSGLEQMTSDNVKKTKKIANARIHVERAINRIKWFKILQNTLPITLVPLIDDIIIVCASLCNFLPPLVD